MGADDDQRRVRTCAVLLVSLLAGLSACAPRQSYLAVKTVSATTGPIGPRPAAALPGVLAETLAVADKVEPVLATAAQPAAWSKLSPGQVLVLARRCAPGTPAGRLLSIARIESGLDPLAININGGVGRHLRPASRDEAIMRSADLVHSGANIDIGLAQINSRTIRGLNYRLADAFDPCTNLKMAAEVLDAAYARALHTSRPSRPISETAYSFYKSGDPDRSVRYGYVARAAAAFHADQPSTRR